MPRKKSVLICPICNESGQLKEKAQNAVHLPKRVTILKDGDEIRGRLDLITTMPEAWNYAAKIFLLMQENQIKYPPSSNEEDDLLANSFYDTFSSLIPHTEEELGKFEERHIKNTEIVMRINRSEAQNCQKDIELFNKKKRNVEENPVNPTWPANKRIRVETSNNKHVSRTSVACLYGSVLFATMSKLAQKLLLPPVPPHPKLPNDFETLFYLHDELEESVYAAAICQIFSQLVYIIDTRNRVGLLQWMEIFKVKEDHGYRRASSFTKSFSNILFCKNCSDLKSHHLVRIEEELVQNNRGDIRHYCKICRGNEVIVVAVPISINTIKKREYEIKLDLIFLMDYCYYFLVYMNYINNNIILIPDFVQVFKEEFSLQEIEAMKSSFLKDRYWYMSHYDKIKKGKRSHYLGSFAESKAKLKNGNENSIKKVPS